MSNGHINMKKSDNDQADAVPFTELEDLSCETIEEPPVPPLRKKNKKNATVIKVQKAPIVSSTSSNLPNPPIESLPTLIRCAPNVFNINKSNGVQIGNNITYIYKKADESTPNECPSNIRPRNKTQRHIIIMQSTEEIKDSYLDRISGKLEDWRGFFRNLEYENSQIDIIEETNSHKGIKEVIFQLFLDWVRNNDKKLGGLCEVLWDQQRYSLVDDIIEMYNKDTFDKMA